MFPSLPIELVPYRVLQVSTAFSALDLVSLRMGSGKSLAALSQVHPLVSTEVEDDSTISLQSA